MFGLSRSELTGVLILMRRDEICPLLFSFREEGLGCLPAILMLSRSVCIDGRPGVFFVLFLGGFLAFPLGVETEWIDIYITLLFLFGDTGNLVRLCVCR
jgi:hypothetical protein